MIKFNATIVTFVIFILSVTGNTLSACTTPVFQYAREKRFPLVIYLTDGWGVMPTPDLACPTLWVLSENLISKPEFPFGRVTSMAK